LRRAELRGAMAEADPPVTALNASLPAVDRLLTWGWRARRQILAGLDYILVLALGAAFGAGFGLGLLRFITALFTGKTPGLFLILNIHFGFFLGGAVALAYLIANPLLLRPVGPAASGPPPASAPGASSSASTRLRLALAVLLGTLFFCLAQAVIVLTTGRLALSGKEGVYGLGMLAGLGWCLALFLLSAQPFWERPRLWPIRMAAAALVFASLQALFLYAQSSAAGIDYRSSLVFLLTGMDYERNFTGLAWISAFPGWFNLLALLDAVLAAGLLTLGALLGARLADRFFRTWRRL
jgi:hypothetical protein